MIRGLSGFSAARCRVKYHIVGDGTLYSCKRLREALDAARPSGRDTRALSCYMNINPAASSIHYKGRRLPHFDAVIPRIGSAITFYGTAALRQFELLVAIAESNTSPLPARAISCDRYNFWRAEDRSPIAGIAHSPDRYQRSY